MLRLVQRGQLNVLLYVISSIKTKNEGCYLTRHLFEKITKPACIGENANGFFTQILPHLKSKYNAKDFFTSNKVIYCSILLPKNKNMYCEMNRSRISP